MSKLLSSAGLACAIFCMPASADTLLGLYIGGQAWQSDGDGGLANSASLTEFNFSDETNGRYFVALEHPVPLIPNVKLVSQSLDSDLSSTLSSNFTFDGKTFASGLSVDGSFKADSVDYILYYEIFDNDLLTVDLGISAKDVDGDVLVQDKNNTSLTASESFSGFIPMLYGKFAFGFPFSGWGVEAEGQFLAIDDSKVYDVQAAVTYSLLDNIAVDLNLQLGYKAYKLELDDVDNVYSDIEFTGPFAGVEVHF